jgi:hypothetical protein
MTCKYKNQCSYELKDDAFICLNGGSTNCNLYEKIEEANTPIKEVYNLSHVFEGGIQNEISCDDTCL